MQRTLTDKIKNMLDFAKQGGKTLTGQPADEIDVHPSTTPGVRESYDLDQAKANLASLRRHKRLGIPHPELKRIQISKDLAAAMHEVDKHTMVNIGNLLRKEDALPGDYGDRPGTIAVNPSIPSTKLSYRHGDNKRDKNVTPFDPRKPDQMNKLKTVKAKSLASPRDSLNSAITAKSIGEHIIKTSDSYELKSKSTGRNLGKAKTLSAIKRRERQVQYFKHANEEVINEVLGNPNRRTYTQNLSRPANSSNIKPAPMSPEKKAEWNSFHDSLPQHMKDKIAKGQAERDKYRKEESEPPFDRPYKTHPSEKTALQSFKDKFGNRISSPEHMARNLAKQGLEKALKDKSK